MKQTLPLLLFLYFQALIAQTNNYKITYIEQYNLGIPVNFTSTLVISEEGSLFLKDVNTRKQGYKSNSVTDIDDILKDQEGIREQVVITGTN